MDPDFPTDPYQPAKMPSKKRSRRLAVPFRRNTPGIIALDSIERLPNEIILMIMERSPSPFGLINLASTSRRLRELLFTRADLIIPFTTANSPHPQYPAVLALMDTKLNIVEARSDTSKIRLLQHSHKDCPDINCREQICKLIFSWDLPTRFAELNGLTKFVKMSQAAARDATEDWASLQAGTRSPQIPDMDTLAVIHMFLSQGMHTRYLMTEYVRFRRTAAEVQAAYPHIDRALDCLINVIRLFMHDTLRASFPVMYGGSLYHQQTAVASATGTYTPITGTISHYPGQKISSTHLLTKDLHAVSFPAWDAFVDCLLNPSSSAYHAALGFSRPRFGELAAYDTIKEGLSLFYDAWNGLVRLPPRYLRSPSDMPRHLIHLWHQSNPVRSPEIVQPDCIRHLKRMKNQVLELRIERWMKSLVDHFSKTRELYTYADPDDFLESEQEEQVPSQVYGHENSDEPLGYWFEQRPSDGTHSAPVAPDRISSLDQPKDPRSHLGVQDSSTALKQKGSVRDPPRTPPRLIQPLKTPPRIKKFPQKKESLLEALVGTNLSEMEPENETSITQTSGPEFFPKYGGVVTESKSETVTVAKQVEVDDQTQEDIGTCEDKASEGKKWKIWKKWFRRKGQEEE